jgi:hypothetical protein
MVIDAFSLYEYKLGEPVAALVHAGSNSFAGGGILDQNSFLIRSALFL